MKDNIKTAEEFYKDYVDFNIVSYEDYDAKTIINDSVLAMKEYAKQFINLAAEKVFINIDNGYDDWEDLNNIIFEGRISINKESILKIKELIK